MFSEDALLPISVLQHLLFCRRQCALIHIERAWAENVFTVQGGILHERAHEQGYESRDGIRVARAVPLSAPSRALIRKARSLSDARTCSTRPTPGGVALDIIRAITVC